MTTIFDVARYIIQKKRRLSIGNLQHLCYYSQVYSLVWRKRPLFREDFESWDFGAVCPKFYELHKSYVYIDNTNIQCGNVKKLKDCQKRNYQYCIR